MTKSPATALDAFDNLRRAMKRGTIPPGTGYRLTAAALDLGHLGPVGAEAGPALRWAFSTFGMPEHEVVRRTGTPINGRVISRRARWDEIETWVGLADGQRVYWTYARPHQCVRWAGFIAGDGAPVWRCTATKCGKCMTITEQRARGLLAPRASAR